MSPQRQSKVSICPFWFTMVEMHISMCASLWQWLVS